MSVKKTLKVGRDIPSNYIELDKKNNVLTLNVLDVKYNFGPVIITPIKDFDTYTPTGDTAKYMACFDGHLKIKIGLEYIKNIQDLGYIGKFSNIREIEDYYYKFRKKTSEKNKIDYSKIKDETYQILNTTFMSNEEKPYFIHVDKTRKNVYIGCQVFKLEVLKSWLNNVLSKIKTIQTNLYDDNDTITIYAPFDDYYSFEIRKNKGKINIIFDDNENDDVHMDQEMITDCIKLLDGKLKTSKYFVRLIPGQLYQDDLDDIKFTYINYCANKDEDDLIKICIDEDDGDFEEQEHDISSFGILTPIKPKEKGTKKNVE